LKRAVRISKKKSIAEAKKRSPDKKIKHTDKTHPEGKGTRHPNRSENETN